MKPLRAALESACRRLGSEPVDPVLVLSRDEQLLCPLALKLGLDPHQLLGDLPGRVQQGMLVLEPRYAPETPPLIGLEPRWEKLLSMARRLGLHPEPQPDWSELTGEGERKLLAYTCWRQAGLGSAERLEALLSDFYESHDVLAGRARVALCRAALSGPIAGPCA